MSVVYATLYEYAFLIHQIRIEIAKGLTLEAAIDEAIAVCLEQDVLVSFLTKHQAEVRKMILSEYDEELHLKDTYNCGYEDGKEAGRTEGREEGRTEGREEGRNESEKLIAELAGKLQEASRQEDLWKALSDRKLLYELYREYNILE